MGLVRLIVGRIRRGPHEGCDFGVTFVAFLGRDKTEMFCSRFGGQ